MAERAPGASHPMPAIATSEIGSCSHLYFVLSSVLHGRVQAGRRSPQRLTDKGCMGPGSMRPITWPLRTQLPLCAHWSATFDFWIGGYRLLRLRVLYAGSEPSRAGYATYLRTVVSRDVLSRPYCAAGGSSFRSIKDWRASQKASCVSTAALKPALRSLTVLTNATGPAGAPEAKAKSTC